MLNRNRQPPVNRQSIEKTNTTVSENSNTDEISTMIVDTLKLLSKNIESIKQTIKDLEERLEYVDSRQAKLEDQFGRYNTISSYTDSNLSSIRNELKILKKDKDNPSTAPVSNTIDVPIMQGTGFASITPGYLKSLHNR